MGAPWARHPHSWKFGCLRLGPNTQIPGNLGVCALGQTPKLPETLVSAPWAEYQNSWKFGSRATCKVGGRLEIRFELEFAPIAKSLTNPSRTGCMKFNSFCQFRPQFDV